MNRFFTVITGLLLLCAAPAYAQVEEVRIGMSRPENNSSIIALKTNLLYDAVLVPNLGIELNLYDN